MKILYRKRVVTVNTTKRVADRHTKKKKRSNSQRVLSELFLRDIIIGNVTVIRAVAVTTVVLLVVDCGIRGHAVVRRAAVLVQNRHASSVAAGCTVPHLFRGVFHGTVRVFHLVEVGEQSEEQATVQADPNHEASWIITLGK